MMDGPSNAILAVAILVAAFCVFEGVNTALAFLRGAP